MDHSWINSLRTSSEYENGVEEFLEFARTHVSENNGRFYCPCVKCFNEIRLGVDEIRDHVICDGFSPCYTRWIWHGEYDMPSVSGTVPEEADAEMYDRLEDMINDVGAEAFEQAHVNEDYEIMSSDAEKPLYKGCKNFSRLSAVLKLTTFKAKNSLSDKGFTELLCLMKHILPEDNELPDSNYKAKKILCPLGLGYKKIHACPNDCILYRKQYKEMDVCPKCGISRYKKDGGGSRDMSTKRPPAKVLWYLPIIPRFKRLFASAKEVENLRWHADEKINDGMIRHPADATQWKKIDQLFPHFRNEPRNLRLGLCTDEMHPHGNLSSQHSSWPVLLTIYNLSPKICMKRKYVLLSMMISGPKQPGNDIDVYFEPLIDDLEILWEDGVDVFDAFKKETFKLRAMVFCTINDFPAYGNLSGYKNKGHKACPICGENTCYHQLEHGKKTIYPDYRKFLKDDHPYRKLKKAFNGEPQGKNAPQQVDDVYATRDDHHEGLWENTPID